MAEHSVLARPYAQAVFDLAREQGPAALAAWSEFLGLAAAAVTVPEVERLLGAPGVPVDRLAAEIAETCRQGLTDPAPLEGAGQAPGLNLLRLLAANGRLAALPDIAVRYEQLRAEAENTLDVTLTSATAVSEAQQARIADALRQRFGRQVRLTVDLEPGLIGGARLKVGDRVIDGSVRNRLDKLATALRV